MAEASAEAYEEPDRRRAAGKISGNPCAKTPRGGDREGILRKMESADRGKSFCGTSFPRGTAVCGDRQSCPSGSPGDRYEPDWQFLPDGAGAFARIFFSV